MTANTAPKIRRHLSGRWAIVPTADAIASGVVGNATTDGPASFLYSRFVRPIPPNPTARTAGTRPRLVCRILTSLPFRLFRLLNALTLAQAHARAPPFSSMNSMPAFSSAARILSAVVWRPPRRPSAISNREEWLRNKHLFRC